MTNLSELFSLVGKNGFSELNVHKDDGRWFFSASVRRKGGGTAHWYAYCEKLDELILLVSKGLKGEIDGRVDLVPSSKEEHSTVIVQADNVSLSDEELELF